METSHKDVSIDTQEFLLETRVENLEEELNKNIGHYWWKSYISTAFWSNFSTPLNLTITILTAITTGQTATDELISQSNMRSISFATLIITTLNTFFRPSTQLAAAMENMNSWRALGNEFEAIFIDTTEENIGEREEKMKKLMKKVLELRRGQKTSFMTDAIHLASRALCIKDDGKWKSS